MTVKGWNRAQGGVEPMTRDELDELLAAHGAPSQSIKAK
jgi:hypothetical protein